MGFEKDPSVPAKKIQTQDPLEEVKLGDEIKKKPTYTSTKIVQAWRPRWPSCLKNSRTALLGIMMKF